MERGTTKMHKQAVRGLPFGIARQPYTAERGQALLEFALVLPLLCALFVGIVDIGRAAYVSIVVANAATAAVEYGTQSATDAANTTGIQNAALCDANGGNWGSCNSGILTSSNITVTNACTCDNGTGLSCNPMPTESCATISCGTEPVVNCLKVSTTASLNPALPWPGMSSSYQTNGNSVMRVRQ